MLQAQVDSGEVIPDDDQRQKIERAAALAQEIEDMRVQLEKTLEGPLEDGDGASDLHVEATAAEGARRMHNAKRNPSAKWIS